MLDTKYFSSAYASDNHQLLCSYELNLQNTNVEYIFVANVNNLNATCNADILGYRQNHIVCLIADESFGI